MLDGIRGKLYSAVSSDSKASVVSFLVCDPYCYVVCMCESWALCFHRTWDIEEDTF